MIEIAIAVGVIGFALVAIIGILPRGMNVQKASREDTIISQDAPYFLNAIRNGEMRNVNNILTNYVESIVVTVNNGIPATNTNPFLISGPSPTLTSDSNIVGLLTIPEYDIRIPNQTNQIVAVVHAMTGSALQQNGANSNMSFRYQLTVEIDPLNFTATGYTPNYLPDYIATNPPVLSAYTNFMGNDLHEIRLRFAWPVFPNGNIGSNRRTFRSLISAHLAWSNSFTPNLWFFLPNTYTNNPTTL